MIVDLHIHSTASDGTDTPEEILKKICKESGVRIFSLTDHDTVIGAEKIRPLIPADVVFIDGAELSCRTAQGNKCHILAYHYNAKASEFQKILEQSRLLHQNKAVIRLQYLSELYRIKFSEADIAEICNGDVIGRSHIVNFVARKYGFDKRKIYDDLRNCRSGNTRIDAEKVIKAVTTSGGIAVWAHPLGGEREEILTATEFRKRLDELVACGIQGLECYYSRYTAEQEKFLVSAAEEKGLLISGGSDYHGTNKENISLGKLCAENIRVSASQFTILQVLCQ